MLDVLLRRNGTARHWTISEWSGRWMCRYTEANAISFSGCDNFDLALARKAE